MSHLCARENCSHVQRGTFANKNSSNYSSYKSTNNSSTIWQRIDCCLAFPQSRMRDKENLASVWPSLQSDRKNPPSVLHLASGVAEWGLWLAERFLLFLRSISKKAVDQRRFRLPISWLPCCQPGQACDLLVRPCALGL